MEDLSEFWPVEHVRTHAMHPLHSPSGALSLTRRKPRGRSSRYILLSAAKLTSTVLTRRLAPRGTLHAAAVAPRRRRGRVSAARGLLFITQ